MRIPRRLAFWGLLFVMATGRGFGSPPGSSVRPVGEPRDPSRFTFRVDAPAPELSETPDGTSVTIHGFERRERHPGAPEIPTQTVLIAIPPGVTPRLEVRPGTDRILRGFRPRPVGVRRADVGDVDLSNLDDEPFAIERALAAASTIREVRVEDPAIYGGTRPYPERLARLGEIGVLRDQRYVEVHIAPVRFDPRASGLRVAGPFEVVVHFDGYLGGGVQAHPDPVYEPIYRQAFANYAQGTTFRLSAVPDHGGTRAFGPSETGGGVSEDSGTTPLQRIRIHEDGLVRLDDARMTGTDFPSHPLSTWKLTCQGVEVPLEIEDGNQNDLLDSGDYVQFYGEALDDDPKAVLNTDFSGNEPDIFAAGDFSDENVYFLTVESGTRSRIPDRSSTPPMTMTPPVSFEDVSHVELDDLWRPVGGADPWYWSPFIGGGAKEKVDVPLPGLASGTGTVRVVARLAGVTDTVEVDPDHDTVARLLNNSDNVLASNPDDGTFDGRSVYDHDFTWTYVSGPTLSDPARVEIEAFTVSGANNQVVRDWIEIHYDRLFTAVGDTLEFEWTDENAELEVSGLASPAVHVYEITDTVPGSGIASPVRVTDATVTGTGPYTVRFRIDDGSTGGMRRFVVEGESVVAVPTNADFEADTVSDLRTTKVADLIIIGHPDVLDETPGNPLDLYRSHRASQGITTQLAKLPDIEDEFNNGLHGPAAIRNFLSWVMSTEPGEGWTGSSSPKPSWVFVIGDGSYDYKGGPAQGSLVPTQIFFKDAVELGYYSSDNSLAAVVGNDELADLMIGRITARTAGEANSMLQKILDYEQIPPGGSWKSHAVFVSDRGKDCSSAEAQGFEFTNTMSDAFLKKPPYTSKSLRYWSDPAFCNQNCGTCIPAVMTQAIKDAVNGFDGFSGTSIFQYEGHGNFNVWSDDAFLHYTDTDTFVNGGRQPWMMAHDCLSGAFHTTNARSMGEEWVKRVGAGGIAVLSPSGLSFTFISEAVADTVWDDVFGPRKERIIGMPVLDALVRLCGQGSIEWCQNYILLGDPSLHLVFPSVEAPTGLNAVGLHESVDLTWSHGGGTTYDVYRTTDPDGGTYVKANGSPIAVTSFTDTGLVNTLSYYYAVVAVDGSGFESAWSNFNSDCDVSGPDCVEAIPLNPDPPATPTGLVVTDAETGGRLDLSWTANVESDLKSYEVHYGIEPQTYTVVKNAGKKNSYVLSGLTDGETYYVAITATNTSGKVSGFSVEESGTPTLILGVKAPGFIDDLHVDRTGVSEEDALLTWTAVTTDIYGKPESVDHYEVYRGTTPDFAPLIANRIGTPATATFTDPGALAPGGDDFHYLVRAIDTDANVGGLGNQLPDGIRSLILGKSTITPGDLVLSWPAVTTDFDGWPVVIDHYEIYASDVPFTRGDIRDGSVTALVPSVAGTSVEITPSAGSRYYSVLAVDARGNKSPF